MDDARIPDDILRNILAKLPGKSVGQSRCVSPRWNRMISDSSFMIKSRSRRMIFLTHHKNLRDQYEKIIGTFKGIVIYVQIDPNAKGILHTVLFNPLTCASKILPDSYNPFDDPHFAFVYGFAHGANLDDSKIVRFRASGSTSYNNLDTCDVFDFKTSSWSTLSMVIRYNKYEFDDVGTFVNGFLYWIATFCRKIMSLNVNQMIVSEIQLPNRHCFTELHLGTLHGRLCMISDTSNLIESGYDIWVMNVENLWSKEFSFTLGFGVNYFHEFRVLNIVDDGRILMVDSLKRLIIFDASKCSYILQETTSASAIDFVMVRGIEYVETLVSPSDICGV